MGACCCESMLLWAYNGINYENTPIQIYSKFHLQKKRKFSGKKQVKYSDIFHISAQNIDCLCF